MNKLSKEVDSLEAIAARARAAVDAWYEKHFHSHRVAGTVPISSVEKDELHRAVASAVQPQVPASAGEAAPERDH